MADVRLHGNTQLCFDVASTRFWDEHLPMVMSVSGGSRMTRQEAKMLLNALDVNRTRSFIISAPAVVELHAVANRLGICNTAIRKHTVSAFAFHIKQMFLEKRGTPIRDSRAEHLSYELRTRVAFASDTPPDLSKFVELLVRDVKDRITTLRDADSGTHAMIQPPPRKKQNTPLRHLTPMTAFGTRSVEHSSEDVERLRFMWQKFAM